jgi:hypothetical protein
MNPHFTAQPPGRSPAVHGTEGDDQTQGNSTQQGNGKEF